MLYVGRVGSGLQRTPKCLHPASSLRPPSGGLPNRDVAGELMNASVQVVYTDPTGVGYHCVYYMARLAAELLGGKLIVLNSRAPSALAKFGAMLPVGKGSAEVTLLICPSPYHLNSALLLGGRQRSGRLVAWVFDSFWPERIPRWVRSSRLFDHVFVTEQEDLGAWRSAVRAPVDWLPWGSDVLNLGSANAARLYDLLRFGRQPAEWDDDAHNARWAQAGGLRFHGRPPMFNDPVENQRELTKLLGYAKFTLAFTNRVSPSVQTHPEREYITGRWTDSLAAGAIVAGIPPRSPSVEALLWPEALLDLHSVDQEESLAVLASAASEWTAARAQLNYVKSLEHLDWRWRFRDVADALQVRSLRLEGELARLGEMVRSSRSAE